MESEHGESSTLLDSVLALRTQLAGLEFPSPSPRGLEARTITRALLDKLDKTVLPRLRELSMPGIVLVYGQTGSGKSTLVNTLARTEVSEVGPLRPTTTRPIMAGHPLELELLADHPAAGLAAQWASDAAPRSMVFVDVPDPDLMDVATHDAVHQLIHLADLWLHTTTANRYGDAAMWQFLDELGGGGKPLAVVVDRVPHPALTELRDDLRRRLNRLGLAHVPAFFVPESQAPGPFLDPLAAAPIRAWIGTLAGADRARQDAVAALGGAIEAIRRELASLAGVVDADIRANAELRHRLRGVWEQIKANELAVLAAGRAK
ncbi:MAG: 50S ribosome-binding GTPase, partial [Bifidobacteriaceae bacterium]|nr:50S ribosome-binding GTPase [Bifidobacteriaceae bacterium]